jgi:rSAM/selenodomain-associated transferase 2
MPPTVSLVIPVLSDADFASALLDRLPLRPDLEVIVVDGGADPQLAATVAGHPGATLLHAPPGRARQMNTGAETAAGTWLFFVHADSILPAGWFEAVMRLDDDVAGGWFRFALDDDAWQARVIERLTAWRVSRLRLPYGDQGIFVRRRLFVEIGGFPDFPLMEDVSFIRRLVRAGRVVEVPLPLRTSARRWRRDGWFRRSTQNVALVCLYFLGVAPTRLARWYRSAARG